MDKKGYSTFLVILFLSFSIVGTATTYYSRINGNWTTATTWSTVSCGGAAASTVPGLGDNVIICAGNTVTMNGNPGNCLSLTINGTANWSNNFVTNVLAGGLTMTGGTLSSSGAATGTLNVTGAFVITTATTATIGGVNLNVSGLTSINGTLNDNNTGGANVFNNVDLNATGKFNNSSAETYTINGNLNTYGGDFLAIGATPTFNIAGNFNVVTGLCDISRIRLTVAGTTTIDGTLHINSIRGTKTFNNIIVNAIGAFSSTVAENYAVNGNITVNGSFNANTGIWTLAGGGKSISGSTILVFDDVTITGSYTNNANVQLTTSLKGSGSLTQGSTGALTLTITNGNFSLTTINASALGNTVTYNDNSNQNIRIPADGSYSNLTLSGGGSFTKRLIAATVVKSNFTVAAATIADANNFNLSIGGNFTNNNSFLPGTATVTFNGTSLQTLGGTSITGFNNLTINNAAGVTLAINTTVSSTLSFLSGVITTAANKVTINTGGSVTGAGTSKFVNGYLEKSVSTGTNVARTYEVGAGATNYLPVNLTFASVTTSGKVTARAVDGDHPNVATSCIDDLKSVNHYWQLTNASTVFTTYSATCNFIGVPTDADAGSLTANYLMALYNSGTWTMPTIGTRTATSTQATGINTMGDFEIGERRVPVVTIQPLSTTVCNNTAASFSLTATGAVSYQWQQNTGAGFVNLANGGIYSGVTTATLSLSNVTTAMNTYQYRCVLNGSCGGTPVNSNAAVLTVTPNVTASVTISASPATTICAGTSVTFTATPTNGGTAPAYQWKKNGVNVAGATAVTFTTTTLANGDVITCVLTSNASCVLASPATSAGITMTVNPNLPVSVSVSASPSTTICAGTSVTFSATPTNGGTTPTYQWKKNGVNIVGATAVTYSTSALANGDVITCVLTSNAVCATGSPATSAGLTMTVNPVLPASVSIVVSPSSTICAGTSVTFTATPINGGTTPGYQWMKNGVNIAGATAVTFTTTTLVNGDIITCVLTSNATCVSGSPATSSGITMTVNPNLPVSVSISASPSTTICAGSNVTFTATPTNGGTTPAYQWKQNGVNIAGATASTFSTTTLANGDVITCVLTSNASCVTGNPATSSGITITVNPLLTPAVSIVASQASPICAGTSVTFTATPTNGGSTPTYQWKLNGANVGTGSTTYTNAALLNGDVVSCVLTSNATCLVTATANSNSLSFVVTSSGTWIGGISSNWNLASNWCGGVPSSSTNVVIPAGTSFLPQLTANSNCNSLTINSGASLNVAGFSINVKGDFTNNGTFIPGAGTIVFDGTGAQSISSVGTLTFYNLTINNSAGVSLAAGAFNLDGVLTCSSGVFSTNGKVFTMTSTATQTARIAPITGTGSIAGDFTVQRYLSARDTSYADLCSPVQGSTFNDWDNELPAVSYINNPPITVASGYTYDETADNFVAITNGASVLTPGKGYEVFLAGDFSYASLPNTTIDVVGQPTQGTQNLSSLISNNAQGWNLVGNPFASSISWSSVYTASGSASSGLYDYIEMYDYTIGDWHGYTSADGIEIGSGQGFWVYGLPAASSLTLTIPETSKTTSSNSSIKVQTNVPACFALKISGVAANHAHTFYALPSSDALNSIDGMDLPFRASPSVATPQLYSVIDNKKLNRNAFNNADSVYSMPLVTKVGYNGYYTIEPFGFDYVSAYTCVQLEDKVAKKLIDLRKRSYEFEMKTTDKDDRFVLHFSKMANCDVERGHETLNSISDFVTLRPVSGGHEVHFNFKEQALVNLEVIDLLGRSLIPSKKVLAFTNVEEVILPSTFSGVYFVKVESPKGTMVKKFIR